jgi:O-antigen ligase
VNSNFARNAGLEFENNDSPIRSLAILILSLAFGFVFFAFDPTARTALVGLAGLAAVGALLAYPELALALYVVVGDVKGDERVAALLPWDLTLALGGLLIAGMLLNLLRGKRVVALPGSYFLILVLVAMMAASLTYAPVFDAGAEKLARFLAVTGIVIIAPFFVLDSAAAMKRFLWGFSLVAFVICAYSLTSLGGSERLVTPSSNTIGLGHIACGLIVVIWFSVLPRLGFLKRMMLYPVLAVPMLALIGSGSRGAVLALGFVLLISVIFHRALLLDLGCMGALGLAAIPFVNIPQASFEYLGTLVNCQSVKALLFFRAELLTYGWTLLQQHPLLGVGIQGFRYYSPNAGLYNWPHNIFLEVSCEMGLGAGLLVIALFVLAIREAWRQLNDSESGYLVLSQIAAALLLVGIVNATNTGDINSDRSTWLFLSIVYVVRGLRRESYRTQIRPVRSLRPATI